MAIILWNFFPGEGFLGENPVRDLYLVKKPKGRRTRGAVGDFRLNLCSKLVTFTWLEFCVLVVNARLRGQPYGKALRRCS
jgi:hypothetical protein